MDCAEILKKIYEANEKCYTARSAQETYTAMVDLCVVVSDMKILYGDPGSAEPVGLISIKNYK